MDTTLTERVRAWSDAGLIDPAQRDAILAYEEAAALRQAQSPHARGIPPIAEALGYIGGTVSLAAAVALLFVYWSDLGFIGRTALAGLVTAACIAGGFFIGRMNGRSANRLEQFLLSAGVLAFGFTVGQIGYELVDRYSNLEVWRVDPWAWFIGATAASLLGFFVWRARRGSLTHVAFGVAVAYACMLLLPILELDDRAWVSGALLVAFGIVWGVLGELGVLTPKGAASSLACLGVLGGIQVIALTADQWNDMAPLHDAALWAGTIVGLAMLAAAVRLKRGVLLGFAAAAVVVFVPQLLADIFGNTVGVPIALLIAGVLLVAMSIAIAKLLPEMRSDRA